MASPRRAKRPPRLRRRTQKSANRPAAAKVYAEYREPFLKTIPGAQSKELLLREEDVQVLHGFDTVEHAAAYLKSSLFQNDVVAALAPHLSAEP